MLLCFHGDGNVNICLLLMLGLACVRIYEGNQVTFNSCAKKNPGEDVKKGMGYVEVGHHHVLGTSSFFEFDKGG